MKKLAENVFQNLKKAMVFGYHSFFASHFRLSKSQISTKVLIKKSTYVEKVHLNFLNLDTLAIFALYVCDSIINEFDTETKKEGKIFFQDYKFRFANVQSEKH